MTTFDSIRDVGIVNKLDRMEKDLQDLKSAQFVGRKVLSTKTTYEAQRWLSQDFYAAGNLSTPVGSNVYRNITFKADSQENPFGRLMMEFYTTSGDRIYNLSDYPGTGINVFYYNYVVTYVGDGTLKWNVDIRGPVNPKFYVQFFVAASGTGVITSEEAS